MPKTFFRFARLVLYIVLATPLTASFGTPSLLAQTSASLNGTVLDPRGAPLPGASLSLTNDATGVIRKTKSDAQGRYTFAGLTSGKYTVQVDAAGFATAKKLDVAVGAGQLAELPIAMQLGNVSAEVTVEANEANSVAAALAPMDALLSETSARTEITSAMINNFMSPVADFGEAVQMAPGTFTTNSNGVGLGQSNTYFRGFPDGDYDIDFDGIPFYDTNSPTHHSWAFFPAQFLGSIDFDRSPGSAASIGPTPFGGSIHLLSKPFDPMRNLRTTFSGGSYNTYLYDVEYDSGDFGPGKKLNAMIDIHHMQSHGYQTLNNQTRNAGDIQFQYKLSDKTTITGYSGVIWLDANTPNFKATRCQMYGAGSAYSCALSSGPNGLYPFTGAGINFLLTNNSDPLLYLDTKYNLYHIPTDFEYVGLHKEMAHNVTIDFKPYTYNYDNAERYAKATTITDQTTINGSKTYMGLAVQPCNVAVVKKGVGQFPCGVDKYNSYRKYGETGQMTQVSRFGILRAGIWYEWAYTNRHQYPSDPTTNWKDSPLPNFSEFFWTNSYQPFAEYEFHIGPKLTFTPGVKWAYYTISTKQMADNGGKIGCLASNCVNANPQAFIRNGGSYLATLPSGTINYRFRNNWSAYVQAAQGSIVPPSNVFDFAQGANGVPVATLPKQQKNTTYQAGTVLKLRRVTFDADVYRIHFDNSYSSFTPLDTGEPVFYLQPSSNSTGVEAESNIYLGSGLSVYLNGSYDKAVYVGTFSQGCASGATGCPATVFNVPANIYVANTPKEIDAEGVTYQRRGWDVGIFNKHVGTQYEDNGSYHNQYQDPAFDVVNANINYTLRSGRFTNTKLELSLNNLLDQHTITGVSLKGNPVTQDVTVNGLTYTDPFNTVGATPINGQDSVHTLPGRSIMFTVRFGLSPER